MPEKEVNEINLKEDSNDNGIPDWAEFTATYLIAAVCISLAVAGYVRQDLDCLLYTSPSPRD